MFHPHDPSASVTLAVCRPLTAALAWVLAATAAQAQTGSTQLAELSLEQLSEVVVRTVSRFDERLDQAAASVYVITADDIRRSGATTLPEALRLAPTLDIARADGSQYAISARGFTNVLANKMLVLIDGRTLYTPLFSGVFWEAQDLVLADVERIEVVTGPSTALWGSNAVNGLVHVITRSAAGSQGLLAQAHLGNRETGAVLRHGFALGARGHMRAYAKAYDRDEAHRADGTSANDNSHGVQIGFRADWTLPSGSLTLQGDAYQGAINQLPSERTFSGANALARWDQKLGAEGELTVQALVERTRREHPQTFGETLDTVDVLAEYGLQLFEGHRLLLGAGFRQSHDEVRQFSVLGFLQPTRDLSWKRVYAQDQVTLAPAWTATLSLSLEKNPYSGTEVLPGLRLAWQVGPAQRAWAGLSRAVRAPSRIDRDYVQPAQPPYVVAGGPNFRSEVSEVYELGWRAQPAPSLSYSVTLFHHEHDRLRSLTPTAQGLQFENAIEGQTRGVEAWARWRVGTAWRLTAGVVSQQQKLRVRQGAVDAGGIASLGNDARHWSSLRSSFDITPRLSWDFSARHVGRRPQPQVPAYTAFDSRVAWSLMPSLELSLLVRNLGDAQHPEWGSPANRVEVERSALLQLSWRH